MTTYHSIDQLIVASIRSGRRPLYAPAVCAEAQRLAQASGREEMRVIDGRLQALRKAGKIAANRKADSGWVVIIEAGSARPSSADYLEDVGPRHSDEPDEDDVAGILQRG